SYAYTSEGNPVAVRAPGQAGAYEVRYVTGAESSTLARAPLTVVAASASVSAPASAVSGGTGEITWQGPDNSGDFVTIVPAGAEEGTWSNYAYTNEGNPVHVTAPEEVGAFEVRYVAGVDYATLASAPLTLEPATATVEAPASAAPNEWVAVPWTRPDNNGDLSTPVPAGSEARPRTTHAPRSRASTRSGTSPARATGRSPPGRSPCAEGRRGAAEAPGRRLRGEPIGSPPVRRRPGVRARRSPPRATRVPGGRGGSGSSPLPCY